MQSKEELKKVLLNLLLEDVEFRYAIAGAIGLEDVRSSLNRLENAIALLAEAQIKTNVKLEEHDAKFNVILQEIKSLREEANVLRQDMLEGFRRHDEEFARVWKSIEDLRRDMQDGFKRLDLKVSALGARWDIMNEESVREALKGIVGKELGYTVQEWNTYDDEGYVYGYPSNVQLDIVVSNGKIIALEVASHVKRSDPLILKRKVELYRKREGRDVSRVMFVTPFIDDEAIDACNRFGIEV
ncbi:MAG: DUF3782 domain-containing protein, partial [Candidatus Nitrosocaldus sp.]